MNARTTKVSLACALIAAIALLPQLSDSRATAAPESANAIVASPAPGSKTASATTEVSLVGASAVTLAGVDVEGSRSGRHTGLLERFASTAGVAYVMATPFVAGETVTVRVGRPVVGAMSGTFSFKIARRIEINAPAATPPARLSGPGVTHYDSAPTLDPPTVTVSQHRSSTGGDLFLTPKGLVGAAGPMILDGSGKLVWTDPLPSTWAFDLNVQPYGGAPALTFWQGVIVDGHGVGRDVIIDHSYRTVATITGGNGFAPDLHEFQLLGSGLALVTSYQAIHWRVPGVGAIPIWDGIAQEIDVRTGLVVYEWHSLDHVAPAASDIAVSANPRTPIDYFHINSIQALPSGDLIISSRNTSAIYEISPRLDGHIDWSVGGKDSSFAMSSGATFWFQHDARLSGADSLSVFDNESAPNKASQSRGLVLHLDFANKVASVTTTYLHDGPLLGAALGNVQRIANGDTLISWGTTPYFTEYGPTAQVLFDDHLPTGDDTYRVYARTWHAQPTTSPTLSVVPRGDGRSNAKVSWNGATEVAKWRLLAGTSRASLQVASTSQRSGFETTLAISKSAKVIEVEAIDARGRVIGTSAEVNVD